MNFNKKNSTKIAATAFFWECDSVETNEKKKKKNTTQKDEFEGMKEDGVVNICKSCIPFQLIRIILVSVASKLENNPSENHLQCLTNSAGNRIRKKKKEKTKT